MRFKKKKEKNLLLFLFDTFIFSTRITAKITADNPKGAYRIHISIRKITNMLS